MGDIALSGGTLDWSIDDETDKGPRTSQRAELLAALMGLLSLRVLDGTCHSSSGHGDGRPKEWIIATDSEYVVKGMAEWLPT